MSIEVPPWLEDRAIFPDEETQDYFGQFSVQAFMWGDRLRTRSYQTALEKVIKPGDVIADIGTGLGLLTLLALRAGAKRVYAIESSSIIDGAREMIKMFGYEDQVIFHQGVSTDINIDERVDVVVSETIGHLAYEEGIIPTLLDARERFLKPGGVLIPQALALYATLVNDKTIYPYKVEYWDKVGKEFDLITSPLREYYAQNIYYTSVKPTDLVSDPTKIASIDFQKDSGLTTNDKVIFEANHSGEVNGLALWFDANLTPNISLSNPPGVLTHWGQAFAPIPYPIDVTEGSLIKADFNLKLPFNRHLLKRLKLASI